MIILSRYITFYINLGSFSPEFFGISASISANIARPSVKYHSYTMTSRHGRTNTRTSSPSFDKAHGGYLVDIWWNSVAICGSEWIRMDQSDDQGRSG